MNMAGVGRYEVSLGTKLAYGLGGLTDSIKTFSFTTFLLFYYTSVLGLPGAWLGLAMSVGLVWDAVVDPLIGHMSDRATVKFGRRHSFMLAGAVCSGASFIAVFNPPTGLSTNALFVWLMASSLCLRSSNSLFMVPYYALGAELTSDYHERTSISAFRTGAILGGTLLAMAAAFLVFLPGDGAPGSDARFERHGYASIGVVFGVTMAVIGLTATLGTLRERSRLASSSARDGMLALSRTMLSALRERSFRVLLVSSSLAIMAAAVNAALAMHFLTYHARIAASQAITLYFVAFYTGALAGVLVWLRVTQWFEKQHVYAATAVITGCVISAGYWLVGDGRPFGTGNLSILLVLNGLSGLFGIGVLVIAPSMMADITAKDQLYTGHRRDGTFFGIYSFSHQLSTGLAVLIAGVLVDRFAGLVPAQAAQAATTIERLVVISHLLPAILLIAAGILALRYGLMRREIQAISVETAPALEQPEIRAGVMDLKMSRTTKFN